MSLVVSHVGWDFVTIGADRGSWATGADGVPLEEPRVMARSKIHPVPAVPVIIATVGAWYDGWIQAWIDDHPLDPQGYSLPEYAKAFVNDYFAFHAPRARARLERCGLSLPADGELRPHTGERLAAGANVIITGLQPGWPRAQLWHADYPGEIEPLHYDIIMDDAGVRRVEQATLHTMGQSDPLRPLLETIDADMPAERSENVVRAALEICERLGRTERPVPVLGPFDVVRITPDGVAWLSGSEGAAKQYV